MGNYIKLQLENILTEGQTIAPEYCDKKYVIYYNPKEIRKKAFYRVTPDYSISMLHEWRKDCTNIELMI